MNKKNTTIYLYILIAVFTVFIGTATYAFFGGEGDISATANLLAETGEAYTFTSTSATDFNLNLTTSDMAESKVGNYVSSTLGSIDITLDSPEGMITACSFDLLFTWNSSDKYLESNVSLPYTHTDGTTYNYEFSTLVKDGDAIAFAERDLSKVNAGAGFGSGSSGTIAENLSVSANGGTINKTYSIEARIYNLPVNQPNLIGKNMNASIKVANVDCQYEIEEDIDVSTLNYLSTNSGNTIFNLVNNQGVDVTNVDSVYFVDTTQTKPGNAENIALFKGTDNNVIKAWTNGNNLYIGSNGTTKLGSSMSYAFSAIKKLSTINFNNTDMQNVTDMSYMFFNTYIDNPSFSLDLGNSFVTTNVTNMSNMFKNISSNLALILNLGDNFNTSNVTDMSNMFKNTCKNCFFTLNLGSHFNTSNVTDMSMMFQYTAYNSFSFSLNLGSHFNTSNVTDMSSMFLYTAYNSSSFSLNLGNHFDTSNVTNMAYMFHSLGSNSTNLILNLGNKFNTTNVTNMSMMFFNLGYQASNFTLSLGEQFNTSKVTNMAYMFTSTFRQNGDINLGNQFYTSNVTDMYGMFQNVGYYVNNFMLNLGNNFDTTNVTNMYGMFAYAGRRSKSFILNLGNCFNTSNVNMMSHMFKGTASNSTNFTLNLGNHFNTSKVTHMTSMFEFAGSNSQNFTLNLGKHFNTSNLLYAPSMFRNAGVNSTNFVLNLGNNFVTSKLSHTDSMFEDTGANASWTLNLKSFNFSNVSNYTNFFTTRTSSNILTILCSPTNGDFINARVSGLTGYNVVCS